MVSTIITHVCDVDDIVWSDSDGCGSRQLHTSRQPFTVVIATARRRRTTTTLTVSGRLQHRRWKHSLVKREKNKNTF